MTDVFRMKSVGGWIIMWWAVRYKCAGGREQAYVYVCMDVCVCEGQYVSYLFSHRVIQPVESYL